MDQEIKVKECCQPTASWLPLKGNSIRGLRHVLLAAGERIYLDLYVSNARSLKLPRVSFCAACKKWVKHGYVQRVGNAYRVTDKVNIPDPQEKLQQRIDMVAETAKRLAEVSASGSIGAQ